MLYKEQTSYKQKITITNIGAFRFWLGILYGLLNAVLFFCFVFLFTETVDLFTVLWRYDIPKVSEASLFYQKLFLVTLSIVFGNSAMIRCWFSIPSKFFNCKNRSSFIKIRTHSLFIEYMVWYVTMAYITRFLFQFPEANLAIYETFGYVFICIPIYLFFVSWTEIIRAFRAQSWMWKTFVFSFVLAALVSFVDFSQYRIAKIAFEKEHTEEIEYVEQEVEYAKRAYGIDFSTETIRSLKELRTDRVFDLLEKTRVAFDTNREVSLDTIIMQKILIHNFKGYYKSKRDSYTYVFPSQVYAQLKKVAPSSNEAKELLNILIEFNNLKQLMDFSQYLDYDDGSTLYYRKISILQDQFPIMSYDNNYMIMKRQTNTILYYLSTLDKYQSYLEGKLELSKIPFTPDFLLLEQFRELKINFQN